MGLFDFLKGKEQAAPAAAVTFPAILGAPSKGTYVPMNQIPDEMFSQGIMGVCCGVAPEEGKVFAPIDAKITQLTDTLHAIGMEAGGMEILIHVGVDTVEMNGDGFTNSVKEGQMVKKGDPLLTMDLGKIQAAGHATTVIMAVTNTDDFASVDEVASGAVQPGDDVLRVNK
ncbi:MAG: PTS glucose transporter subunit IIA [Oscillospiraceae bacterium]|jgi:glucose-specific phosphotransferase system IIA component|nr:PTS glucose transporter subunit IIA [Oscillospiraceae bacterium]